MFDPLSLLLLGAEGALLGPMLAGSVLYNHQKYEEAGRAFRFAARVQPLPGLRARCYINLSACHAEMAQPELTLKACDQAEKSSNSHYMRALSHINRAHAYLLLGEMEQSQRQAEMAIELSPHWRRVVRYAMVNYADAMGRMGRYPEALQMAREALHNGGVPDGAAAGAARREIGMLLIQMGRPREALQEMEQALQLGPNRPEHRGMIYQIMASAWVSLGDGDEATRALSEAERLGVPPVNRPVLQQARARICMLQGQVPKAIDLLVRAEADCQTPLVRLVVVSYLACCLCEQRRFADAISRVDSVIEGGCQYKHILAVCALTRARALFEQGMIEQGCIALATARAFEGMSPILDASIALTHAVGSFEAENFQDAAGWARSARRTLESTQGYPEMRRQCSLWLGRSLTRLGDPELARSEIDAGLNLVGSSHREIGSLLHARGEALLARNDPDGAHAAFQESVHSDGDNPRAWFSLGQLLARRRQWIEGEACLRAAAASDPEGYVGRDAILALRDIRSRRDRETMAAAIDTTEMGTGSKKYGG